MLGSFVTHFYQFLMNIPSLFFLVCTDTIMSNSSPLPLGFLFIDSICSSTTSLGRAEKKGLLGIFQFSKRKSKVCLWISVAVFWQFVLFIHVYSELILIKHGTTLN